MLPLPRYTRRKWLEGSKTWAYYFEPPSWARNAGRSDDRGECPVGAEDLGTDYAAAIGRAETVLLPLLDSWRTRGLIDIAPSAAPRGTLDWLFAQYRSTDKFRRLDRDTRSLHEAGFALVGSYVLKDGRRLGSIKLELIDTGVVDPLYEKLLKIPMLDAERKPVINNAGEPVMRERRTTVNHAMKSCRRSWNVAARLHPKEVPALNPFSKMGLRGSEASVSEARYGELIEAVAHADALGLPSLAAALMVTWEWLQREEHIFTAFELSHYRPKDRPNEVLIRHPKNGTEVWIPLFDHTGAVLFPELMARMDALKRDRVGGLFFVRDWHDQRAKMPLPWVSPSGDLTYVRKKTKAIVKAAGLRSELSFTSFRHGGFTELGDSDLTDAQVRALSRQKSAKMPGRYIKRTQRQIIAGTHKRRATREAADAS